MARALAQIKKVPAGPCLLKVSSGAGRMSLELLLAAVVAVVAPESVGAGASAREAAEGAGGLASATAHDQQPSQPQVSLVARLWAFVAKLPLA